MLLYPRHIILILSQPVFALTLKGEAANTNIIVFGSTGPVVKLRSYHIYTPAMTPLMWLALNDAVVISFLKVKS